MRSHIFDRLSFLSLFLVIVLLPLFCLPFTNIPVETAKGLLLVLGLAISVVCWALARFVDGKISFPRSWLITSGFGIALVVLLSSLFSVNTQVSMFGTMFDIGSFWFIFCAFVLMLMSAITFRTLQKAKTVLLGVILSSAFVLIFQSLHLFAPTKLSLGILADKTGNILGSWNALGLFAGFATLMFLLVIEFFPISKIEKFFLEVLILLSVLMVAAVNFTLVWILLGISALIIFVYKVSITSPKEEGGEEEHHKKHFPTLSFVVVMLSLLFFMSSGFIGAYIPSRLGLSNNEVSPSFSATMTITKGVLGRYPLFGIGPNRFGEAWAAYKPLAINSTQFSDVSFDSGSGLLPTFTATSGGLGILAWAVFLILFLITGVKSLFSSIKNGVNWEMMAFFVLSLYLFIASFFYLTGTAIFLLALVFTGVFVGLASANSEHGDVLVPFLNDHRKSFFSILLLVFVIVFTAATTFKYLERFASVSYFGDAISAPTVPLAESSINKALALYTNDLYLRTYSQIYLVKLNSIASKGGTLSDTDKTDLQTSFSQAVASAQTSTTYDPNNYLNFQLLGSVYQTVGALGVKDAYSNAITAFQDASNLNPLDPDLKLDMASAAFANGDVPGAINYATQALNLKPNYEDALITLSQIYKSQGNNSEALSYAQEALSLDPTNKDLITYVNSLGGSATATPATPETPTTTPAKTSSSTTSKK